MNFNRLIDLGRGCRIRFYRGKFFEKIARCVCLDRKVVGFQRVEFFFGEMPERVLFDAYTVSNCQIQTSFSDKVVSFVRCSLSTWNLKTRSRFAGREISSRGKREEKRGEKGRGIFVIRKRKVRLSRSIAVAPVPRDLWFNAFSLADFNAPTSRPKIFHH